MIPPTALPPRTGAEPVTLSANEQIKINALLASELQGFEKRVNRREFVALGAVTLLAGSTVANYFFDSTRKNQTITNTSVQALEGFEGMNVDRKMSLGDVGLPTTSAVLKSIKDLQITTLPAKNVTYNQEGTTVSAKNVQDAITQLATQLDEISKEIASKSGSTHTHLIGSIIGLQQELNNKVFTNDPRLTDARTPLVHTHPSSDLTQSGALNGQVLQWNGTSWIPATVSGTGDMLQALYDPDGDGKVVSSVIADNATQLGGQPASSYVTTTAFTTGLASKENTITPGTTSQYWRGDKSWQTLDKTSVGLSNVANSDTTNAANIISGTLSTSRLPANLSAAQLQNIPISNTAPVLGQLLYFNGTNWIPATLSASVLAYYITHEIFGNGNGVTVSFSLASVPVTGKEQIYKNGVLQRPGGNDYTITGQNVVFVSAPLSGAVLTATYWT